MGAARILVIIVAFVAAVGVVVIMRGTLTKKPIGPTAAAAAPMIQPMAQVLVAKKDLGIGKRIEAGDIGWQSWPAGNVNAAFITDGAAPAVPIDTVAAKATKAVQTVVAGAGPMEALYGAIVREPLLTGEPLVARKIVRGGQGGYMSVMLQPGMRAIGVGVTVETGAGGFILPGDRVDLMQSQQVEASDGKSSQSRVTQVIVQNVRVLAIDQKTAPEKDAQAVVGAVATLEVPADAVSGIVDAKARETSLFLVLRSYADMGGEAGRGGAIKPRTSTIKVFRNGQVSEVAAVQ